MFNFAIRRGRYDINPVASVRQYKEPPGRNFVVNREQFQSLLDHCGVELRVFVTMATVLALRKNEAPSRSRSRKWTEVRLDSHPSLEVPFTKTDRPKSLPMPKEVASALKELPSYGKAEYLFPSRPTARFPNPKAKHRWDLGKDFRTAAAQAGLKGLRIHDLRHVGPSVLLMAGVSKDVVRKVTGHTSDELDRYQHLSEPFRATTTELIAEALLKGPEVTRQLTRARSGWSPTAEEGQQMADPLGVIGGADETRTRDLRRDRPAF